jgi:hypothetical protein
MGRRLMMMMKAYRIPMFVVDEGAESCYERIFCKVENAVDSAKLLRRLPSFCSLWQWRFCSKKRRQAYSEQLHNCEVWVPAAFDRFGASGRAFGGAYGISLSSFRTALK